MKFIKVDHKDIEFLNKKDIYQFWNYKIVKHSQSNWELIYLNGTTKELSGNFYTKIQAEDFAKQHWELTCYSEQRKNKKWL